MVGITVAAARQEQKNCENHKRGQKSPRRCHTTSSRFSFSGSVTTKSGLRGVTNCVARQKLKYKYRTTLLSGCGGLVKFEFYRWSHSKGGPGACTFSDRISLDRAM